MARQNVYHYAGPHDPDAETYVEGWFDIGAPGAASYYEGTRRDGTNNRSLATGSQWDHEELWRTAGDRWVINWWSERQGHAERWYFIDNDQARDWLTRNEYSSERVDEILGEDLEDESGPRMGRPTIGPTIKVAVDPEALTRVDEAADRAGVSRAEWVRRAIDKALA